MKTRGAKKSKVTDCLSSPPLQTAASPDPSLSNSPPPPIKFPINLNTFKRTKTNNKKSSAAASVPLQPTGASYPMSNHRSIADLKILVSSRLESLNRQSEQSQFDFRRNVEAFTSGIHKQVKIQTEEYQQAIDEDEDEWRKKNEKISKSQETIMASYMKLEAKAQASASCVWKTSIPELAQSREKSIENLRSRYGASTSG